MNETLAHYYDGFHSGNKSGVVTPGAVPRNRCEACILRFGKLFRGGEILELGAGNGMLARSLMACGLPFDGYTLTDRSASGLKSLEKSFDHANVHIAHVDAEHVEDELFGRFDAILMVALIEHLVDPMNAMRRIRRCLKPGGFVYIDTPNIAKFTRRLKLLFGQFPGTASRGEGLIRYDGQPATLYDEGHLHYFTYRSLTRMLIEHCGFSRVEKRPYTVGNYLSPRVDHALAMAWPELFGELCVVAWA